MNKLISDCRYSLHVITRPFDGFWDLKNEKRGRLGLAIAVIVLTIMTFVIQKQNTAFLFNTNKLEEINVVLDITTVLLVYILWCAANWALTTLMDGEGSMRNILIYSAYALIPIVLINLPLVAVSHVITADEAAFYYALSTVSYIWAAFLLFVGTLVTHQYSILKTVLTIFLIFIGMMILLFIGLLFFYVIAEMVNYGLSIYTELRYR